MNLPAASSGVSAEWGLIPLTLPSPSRGEGIWLPRSKLWGIVSWIEGHPYRPPPDGIVNPSRNRYFYISSFNTIFQMVIVKAGETKKAGPLLTLP